MRIDPTIIAIVSLLVLLEKFLNKSLFFENGRLKYDMNQPYAIASEIMQDLKQAISNNVNHGLAHFMIVTLYVGEIPDHEKFFSLRHKHFLQYHENI